jgi:hypothetical protein
MISEVQIQHLERSGRHHKKIYPLDAPSVALSFCALAELSSPQATYEEHPAKIHLTCNGGRKHY